MKLDLLRRSGTAEVKRGITEMQKVLFSVTVFLIVSLASFFLIFDYFYRG